MGADAARGEPRQPPRCTVSGLQGPNAYATWVHTLQAWAKDPSTPLDHLPHLEDDTYTPETYARLFAYVNKALSAVTERWAEGLHKAVGRARDAHELSRALHELRPLLARRVQLARLPAHPPGIRTILEDDLRTTIARLQKDLEDNLRKQTDRARLDHSTQETLLRVVRENPLTAVLSYEVDDRGRVTAPQIPSRVQAVPASSPRWRPRRVVPIPDPETSQ